MDTIESFSKATWDDLPQSAQAYIIQLEGIVATQAARIQEFEKSIDKLNAKQHEDSSNSNKPPSTDSPYRSRKNKRHSDEEPSSSTKAPKAPNRPKGGQPGHKGHRQQPLSPTNTQHILPKNCQCGCVNFSGALHESFYTHQHIELPQPRLDITHFILHKCTCPSCGNEVKAQIPEKNNTGYGPRFSAMVAELSGPKGLSRLAVQNLIMSLFALSISTGAIQNIIDRTMHALEPIYNRIADVARSSYCNYVDETSWKLTHDLCWLWVMVNKRVGFYRIDPHRSKEAFENLVADWKGILISDGYQLYCKWVNHRQTCIPHIIRKAEALTLRNTPHIKRFGEMARDLLYRLMHFSKEPPDDEQWTLFFEELIVLISLYGELKDEAGILARHIHKMMDSLWVFLEHDGIEPSNNRAERALRMAVLWRKRSLGTQSDKGNHWVEEILSLVETCRLNDIRTFDVLSHALECYFDGSDPDSSWI